MTRLLAKGALLLIAAAVLQLLLFSKATEGLNSRFQKIQQSKPDVLYFGDSTNGCTSPDDLDQAPISAMLDGALEMSVAAFDRAGNHAEIYELFINRIPDQPYSPRYVIVPINLRSFSPLWDLDPSLQLDMVERKLAVEASPLMQALDPVAGILNMHRAPSITQARYMNSTVYLGREPVGKVFEFRNGSASDQFLMNYLYELDPRHRKLLALDRVAETADKGGIGGVVFYVTPIDVQAGERCFPGRFVPQVSKNIDLLRTTLSKHNVMFVDLAFGLESDCFYHGRRPCEHLNEHGRRYVAARLRNAIQSQPHQPQQRFVALRDSVLTPIRR